MNNITWYNDMGRLYATFDIEYTEQNFTKLMSGDPIELDGKQYIVNSLRKHPTNLDAYETPRRLPITVQVEPL